MLKFKFKEKFHHRPEKHWKLCFDLDLGFLFAYVVFFIVQRRVLFTKF